MRWNLCRHLQADHRRDRARTPNASATATACRNASDETRHHAVRRPGGRSRAELFAVRQLRRDLRSAVGTRREPPVRRRAPRQQCGSRLEGRVEGRRHQRIDRRVPRAPGQPRRIRRLLPRHRSTRTTQGSNAESRGIEFDMAGRITTPGRCRAASRTCDRRRDGQDTRTYVPRDTFCVATTVVDIAAVEGLCSAARCAGRTRIHVDDVAFPTAGRSRRTGCVRRSSALMARYEFAQSLGRDAQPRQRDRREVHPEPVLGPGVLRRAAQRFADRRRTGSSDRRADPAAPARSPAACWRRSSAAMRSRMPPRRSSRSPCRSRAPTA